MFDKLVALASLLLFVISLGVLVWLVEGWALKIILAASIAMAAYDFWLDAFSTK